MLLALGITVTDMTMRRIATDNAGIHTKRELNCVGKASSSYLPTPQPTAIMLARDLACTPAKKKEYKDLIDAYSRIGRFGTPRENTPDDFAFKEQEAFLPPSVVRAFAQQKLQLPLESVLQFILDSTSTSERRIEKITSVLESILNNLKATQILVKTVCSLHGQEIPFHIGVT